HRRPARERHVDLEHHRGLVRAHDHIVGFEHDRLRERVRLIPERTDALVPDVRWLPHRVVPHRVGREEVDARLFVVVAVGVDVRVDDRAHAFRIDHAPLLALASGDAGSGQRTSAAPAYARLCRTSGSSETTTIWMSSAAANWRSARSRASWPMPSSTPSITSGSVPFSTAPPRYSAKSASTAGVRSSPTFAASDATSSSNRAISCS